MIHRFSLSCKVLPGELVVVLSLVIEMVNNVKGSTLNSRLFKILCEDLSADYSVQYFYFIAMSEKMLLNMYMSFARNCWDFFNNPKNVKILSLEGWILFCSLHTSLIFLMLRIR